MKKQLLISIAVLFAVFGAKAGIIDSLSIGGACAYTSYQTLKGEIYFSKIGIAFNKPVEIRFGVTSRKFEFEFDGVKNLEASSAGLFADAIIYPFNRGLFAGIRWELLDINVLSDKSVKQFESVKPYLPVNAFTGSCAFLLAGYRIGISPKMNLKISAMAGAHQYKMSSGSVPANFDVVIENKAEFIYEFHAGIEIRIN